MVFRVELVLDLLPLLREDLLPPLEIFAMTPLLVATQAVNVDVEVVGVATALQLLQPLDDEVRLGQPWLNIGVWLVLLFLELDRDKPGVVGSPWEDVDAVHGVLESLCRYRHVDDLAGEEVPAGECT